MSVKDSKKAAKQVGMIDREMTVRPVLNRLVLNHRAERFACFREVRLLQVASDSWRRRKR